MFFNHEPIGKPHSDHSLLMYDVGASNPRKLLLGHRQSGCPSNTPCLARPHSSPQKATLLVHVFSRSNATNFPLITMDHPISTRKIARSHGVINTTIYTAYPWIHTINPPPPKKKKIASRSTIHRTDGKNVHGKQH